MKQFSKNFFGVAGILALGAFCLDAKIISAVLFGLGATILLLFVAWSISWNDRRDQ